MFNYMRADFYRLFRRLPRLITLAIVAVTSIALVAVMIEMKLSLIQLSSLLQKALPFACAFIGLIEIMAVYGDDFKAKTMQIAIGNGVGRPKIVLAKWLEFLAVCVIDFAVIYALVVLTASVKGLSLIGHPATDLAVCMGFELVKSVAGAGFAMIVMFFFQSSSLGGFIYLAYVLNILASVLDIVLGLEWLKPFHLSSYVLSKQISVAQSRLIVGYFSAPHFAGILIWLIVLYAVCCLLFQKRELEF